MDSHSRSWPHELPTVKAVLSWLGIFLFFSYFLFFFGSEENYVPTFPCKNIVTHSGNMSSVSTSSNGQCTEFSSSLGSPCKQVSPFNHTDMSSSLYREEMDSRWVLRSDTKPSAYCHKELNTLRAVRGEDEDLLCGAHKAAMVPWQHLTIPRWHSSSSSELRSLSSPCGGDSSIAMNIPPLSTCTQATPTTRDPETSLFHGKAIQSRSVKRFSMTLVDAQRRLLANAMLDTSRAIAWFTCVCESTLPVRSFPFVLNYIMNSKVSFIEAIMPRRTARAGWNTEPEFQRSQLREGEAWMSMHRRHAGLLVGDSTIYDKFDRNFSGSAHDERYSQTLLSILDTQGIANRNIMYVDWSDPHHSSHPRSIAVDDL